MSDKKNLQEISPALKLAYRVKAKTAIKELQPHANKGEYKDLAKNIINKRKAGIAKSMGEEAVDMGANYVNKTPKTPQEKFKSGLKKAGYDPDAGAKRLLDLIAKQKAERAEHDKKYGHLYGEEVESVEEGLVDFVKGVKRKVAGKEDPTDVLDRYARTARREIGDANKYNNPAASADSDKAIKRYSKVSKLLNKEEVEHLDEISAEKGMKQHSAWLKSMEGQTSEGIAKKLATAKVKHDEHAADVRKKLDSGAMKQGGYEHKAMMSKWSRLERNVNDLSSKHDYLKKKEAKAAVKEETDIAEAMDPEHPIAKEYQALKKHDIGTLRGMIKGQQKIVDASEYRSKDHAISAYLRHKHGDKKVAAAMGLKEDVDLDEALQQTLRKYVPGHAKREIDKKMDAEKFGKTDVDKDANYYRYKKIADKLNKEEVEIDEAAMHRVNVTVSDPNHTMATKRNEKIQKIVRVKALDKDNALHKANQYYKDRGYRVHGAEHVGTVNEVVAMEMGEEISPTAKAQGKIAMKGATIKKSSPAPVTDAFKEDLDQIDESANRFIQKVNQAANAAASGNHKNAQMHLDNARTFMMGVKSTDMGKIKDAHATYKNLRSKYAGSGGNFTPKDDQVGVAKVIHNEETQIDEAWNMGSRNPQRGIKVGHKVRSYDFPGMHDDHYVEGHVVGETPSSYHLRVNKVVRAGKEVPIPAHMVHVEAPKGTGMFNQAYAVHKILDKQNQVAATPDPATGAEKTFRRIRGK